MANIKMETVEPHETEDTMEEGKTIHERRRKGSPLSIQLHNKRQKTGPVGEAQGIWPQDAPRKRYIEAMQGQHRPVYTWMARWVHAPFVRLIIDPKILYSVPIIFNVSGQPFPSLSGLPFDVVMRIFAHLDPPWQICLALTCKLFAHASYHVNQGHGLLYTRGDKLRLMWRLKLWMTPSRKMCNSCEKYLPVSTRVWKVRKQQGRVRTGSHIYGKNADDFRFDGEDCPECTAQKRWERVVTAHNDYLQTFGRWQSDLVFGTLGSSDILGGEVLHPSKYSHL